MTEQPALWIHLSPSASQNAEPIFNCLLPRFRKGATILEIGSGTGQHAVHACTSRPDLIWFPSEHPQQFDFLQENLARWPLPGIRAALACDVLAPPLHLPVCDTVYTSNTLHIMSEHAVVALLRTVSGALSSDGLFYSYGPFRFPDRPPVASNEQFDAMLRAQDPDRGVRSVDWLDSAGQDAGLQLVEAIEMPSNNHILVWSKFHT